MDLMTYALCKKALEKNSGGGGLPRITSSDAGKIAGVTNAGEWGLVENAGISFIDFTNDSALMNAWNALLDAAIMAAVISGGPAGKYGWVNLGTADDIIYSVTECLTRGKMPIMKAQAAVGIFESAISTSAYALVSFCGRIYVESVNAFFNIQVMVVTADNDGDPVGQLYVYATKLTFEAAD